MKTLLLSLSLFSLSILTGCSTLEVSQDYEPGTDFNQIKSVQWLPEAQQIEPKANDFAKRNPLIAKRIDHALTETLKTKGIDLLEKDADGYITYHVSTNNKIRSRPVTTSVGIGAYSGFGGSIGIQSSPDVEQYTEGRLLVDILDKKGTLLWRGAATDYVEEHSTPEESTQSINTAIQKMMDQYPPK